MKLDFEYGQGLMSANLPDNTDIFVPGETVPDPECLPQDWDTLYGETLKSIRNPIGMKPLRELAHKGSTVVIIIPTSSRAAISRPATARSPSAPASTSCIPSAWRRRTSCCCSPTACIRAPACRR